VVVAPKYRSNTLSKTDGPTCSVEGNKAMNQAGNHLQLNNGRLSVKVHGGSMGPFIGDGDIIITKKVDPKAMVRGEVILYRRREKYCAHRIIRKSKENGKTVFITKGDRLYHLDAPVDEEQILGKVIAVMKKNQIINLTSKKWRALNLLLLLYSLSTLYIFNHLLNGFLPHFRKKVN
jgi:signal peptidase I